MTSRTSLHTIAIFAFAAAMLVAVRLHLPFLEPEEGRYAEIPRQMLVTESYLVPVLDGQAYLDKPPLAYWLNITSYRWFGTTGWAARISSCLVAWTIVILVMAWSCAVRGVNAGLTSGAVLLTCPDFVYRGPMLTPNGLLTLCVTGGWAAGRIAMQPGRRRWTWLLVSAVATALGVLTKGPVAFVLVGMPLFGVMMLRGELGKTRWLAPVFFALAVATLSAPWFVAVALKRPEFLEYFFWTHNVQRALDPLDHEAPPWYYLPRLLLGAGPWVVVLGWWLIRNRRPPQEAILPLLAAATTLAFLSAVASKRPVYLLPVYPALAVGIGVTLATGQRELPRWMTGLTTALFIGVLAGAVIWLPRYHRQFSLREIVAELPKEIASSRPIYCYPHDWPSAGFQLGRGDLMTFPRGQEEALIAALPRDSETVLILKDGESAKQLINRLPTNLKWMPVAESGVAEIGIVEPK